MLVEVFVIEGMIFYVVKGWFGVVKVIMLFVGFGMGIIVGVVVCVVCEVVGISNILIKSMGSNNLVILVKVIVVVLRVL